MIATQGGHGGYLRIWSGHATNYLYKYQQTTGRYYGRDNTGESKEYVLHYGWEAYVRCSTLHTINKLHFDTGPLYPTI